MTAPAISEAWRRRLPELQTAAGAVAAVSVALAFAASAGFGPLPPFGDGVAYGLHALLVVAGAACGLLGRWRVDDVEQERWHHVEDELSTQGEREYAHKEAERQRRAAGTYFALAPTCVAFWLAQEAHTPGDGIRPSDLLMVTPLLAYFATFLLTGRRRGA